jgi:hypothetical protein
LLHFFMCSMKTLASKNVAQNLHCMADASLKAL